MPFDPPAPPVAPTTAPPPRAVWLDRQTPPHIVTLVLLTGVSALSLNVLLPSLPSIAAWYGADYGVAALAISAYLGLTAVLQLMLGPLSDRFGRRPVLIGCFSVFLLATVGCALAPTIEIFLAFRMAQAVVASGIALSRAIVRDMVPADQAASLLGYVTMGMSLVPMVSPMIGGWLDETFGWQAVILFMLVAGAAVLVLMVLDLGETNRAPSASFVAQVAAYPELLRSQRFWGYVLTAALASGAFFSLLGGGPWVATHLLGMSPSSLGFHFAFISTGYLIGNFLSGRFATRVGLNGMMLAGAVASTFGMGLVLLLFAAGIQTPLSFFGSILFVGLGNGLLLPSANAGMVSVRPHLAGSASGLGGAVMIGSGAALSVVSGALLGPETGAWPLIWIMLVCSALGIVTSFWVMRRARLQAS